MISRRNLLKALSALGLMTHHASHVMAQNAIVGSVGAGKKGVMLMNRIGPSSSDLYIANADGTGERKLLQNAVFEYNASFAPDGKSVLFTSERNGDGQSDVFRARLDGTGIEPVVTGPSVDDAAVLSPDGTRVAFVSTRNGYRANIWVLDLKSGADAQPDRRRGRAGRSRRPQLFPSAVLVAGRPVARVLVRPQHRLARPQTTATAGSTRRSSASM